MKKGWEVKKLSEVCKLINGRAYKKAELLDSGKYPVLRVGNFFTNRNWYYSDLELPVDKYCHTGDLLYAWSASFGPRIWEGDKSIYHYHIWKVVPDDECVHRDYLFQFFEWDKDLIKNEQGTGTTMIHVGKGSMENRAIPVPPLAEQEVIVEVLDKAFAAIDQAKSNIEQNIANAKELFQSKLNQIFSQKGKGWVEKTLRDVIKVKHGFAFKSKFFTTEGEYVLLTPGNYFEEGGYRDRGDKQKFYDGEIPDGFILEEDDLLLAMTEQAAGLLGSPLLVPESDRFLHNQRLGLIQHIDDQTLSNRFLFHAFNTQAFRDEIHHTGTGVKVRHTSPTKICDVTINVTSDKNTQEDVVKTLETLKIQTESTVTHYQTKLASLDELKKSILQKAFAGELT